MSRYSFIFANKAGHLLSSAKFIQPKRFSKVLVCSWSTFVPQGTIKDNPIVTVQQGQVRGAVAKLLDGSKCYSFKGIPYAQPPIGKLRFKAPLPPQPWNGIYEAAEHGEICPQVDTITMKISQEGDENCLFLNIYTKSLNPSNLPVMVYIHGGAFMSGSGNSDIYGPDFILQHDVILVTINFRLEVLGFLCLDTPEVPGNAGLKDQVAALKWIKNNIAQFGGDPNNITLFGESAGAAAVTYHMMSSMSKGLFNKAIAQSGTCIDDWAVQKDAKARAFRIAKAFGRNIEDVNELLEFLQGLPAFKLAALTFKTRSEDEKKRGLPIHFSPVVEKRFDGVESFINDEPLDLLTKKVSKVPLMIGYNAVEGLLMLGEQMKKIDFKSKNLQYFIPRELALRLPEDKMKDFGKRVQRFYAGDREFSKDTAKGLVDLQTDLHFCYNANRFLHFYAAENQAVYAYRFNYVTDLNFMRNMREVPADCDGASHADDLFYLFSNIVTKDVYLEQDKLKEIVWKVTKLWTNFAKTSNPTPDDALGVKWNQYNNTTRNFFNIQEPLSNGQCVEKERVAFWNKLYSEAGAVHIPKSNL